MSQEEEQAQPQQEQSTQPFRYMRSRCLFAEERGNLFLPRYVRKSATTTDFPRLLESPALTSNPSEEWDGFLHVWADSNEKEQLFLIPKNLLAKASDRFSDLVLTGDPPEINFSEEDAVVFGAFVNWLLERQLPEPPGDDLPRFDGTGDTVPTPISPLSPTTPATPATPGLQPALPSPRHPVAQPQNISQYMALLIDLHVFADAWHITLLKIAATEALAEALARWWVYPAPELRYIQSVTREESQLRRLAAMRALHAWDVFVVWRQRAADLDARFVADVEALRERLGDGQRGHGEWCDIDLCQFHDHRTMASNGDH
ncbi:uncharacterized protein J3D65DRAFT_167962 [Phyllosticta citribraziliensis]|uniref:BTB domain-containing protein n=1 Tax=Phyllosticta citribraziliensis TaxID=989973 RepID=A0ABR1L2L0_9PEZI